MNDTSAAIEFVLDDAGEAINPAWIAAVYFTCRAAQFQQELHYDEE